MSLAYEAMLGLLQSNPHYFLNYLATAEGELIFVSVFVSYSQFRTYNTLAQFAK
jgi:hypothetical protein